MGPATAIAMSAVAIVPKIGPAFAAISSGIEEAVTAGIARFGGLNPNEPEFASVEAFAEHMADNDREEYTAFELQVLNATTRKVVATIKAELADYGLTLKHRDFEKPVRGFTANPNAGRFDGMHGGGGGTSIQGFAGYAG